MSSVLCRKKGIVSYEYCAQVCPHWKYAKEGNIYGNSTRTCENFGHIIRTREELAQMQARYVQPGTAEHERLSKKMESDEDRDTDHTAKRTWPIAVTHNPYIPIQGKDIRKKIGARKIL